MALAPGRAALEGDRTLVGRALCRAYSDLVDGWLAELARRRGGRVRRRRRRPRRRRRLRPGRARLQSDIDVLLLHAGRADIGAARRSALVPDLGRGAEARPRGAHRQGGARAGRRRPRHGHLAARRSATSPATPTSPTTWPPARSRSGSKRCQAVARRAGTPGRATATTRPARWPSSSSPTSRRAAAGCATCTPSAGPRRPQPVLLRGRRRRRSTTAYDALLVGPGRAAPPHRPARRPAAARGAGRAWPPPSATPTPTP